MEDGFEQFDINEGDIEHALNPGKFRRQTREEQIFGIWAQNEEEESTSGRFNYNEAIPFISGGVSVGNRMKNEDDVEPSTSNAEKIDDVTNVSFFSDRKPKVKNDFVNRRFAGISTLKNSGGSEWTEKSGKGSVILNMMKKMGYESGKGLGANKQGIVEPVQAILRPGRGAVGAYGNETSGLQFGESATDAQKREKGEPLSEDFAEDTVPRDSWKKSNATKIRVKYKTLDEVVNEADQFKPSHVAEKLKIIDMTGPEQKVYDSYNSFAQRGRAFDDARRDNFDIPALSQNLNALLTSCVDEIQSNNSHLEELKLQTSGIERDQDELKVTLDEFDQALKRIENVLELVEFFDRPTSGNVTQILDEFKDVFLILKNDFAVEYQVLGLEIIVEFKILPIIEQMFKGWKPMEPENMTLGLTEMEEWRNILCSKSDDSVFESNKDSSNLISMFDMIMWQVWMPPIRKAVLLWDARSGCDHMIKLVTQWIPVLPRWIRENVFEQVIIPQIRRKVDEWDPVMDHIPIDQWLLPWHDLLGDRLLVIYPQVRQKLAIALRRWQPTDLTALAVLKPWKGVFSNTTMHGFLLSSIVPKLEAGLGAMDLDPTKNTTYDEFHATLEWIDLIDPNFICQILTRSFFNRWYDNLCHWLQTPLVTGVDRTIVVREATDYYIDWKNRVPEVLKILKPIQAEFIRVLVALKQASQGVVIVPMPSFEHVDTIPMSSFPILPPEAVNDLFDQSNFAPATLRQLIEQRAKDLSILFVPQQNRYQNGRQIYWFGERSIYLDGTAVFTYDTFIRQWSPIGVEHLFSSV